MPLCILSHVLGNRTLSNVVHRAVRHGATDAPAVVVDAGAFQRAPMRAWDRRVAAWEAIAATRFVLAESLAERARPDAVVTTSWEALVAARQLLPDVPAVAVMDGTPRNARELPDVEPQPAARRAVRDLAGVRSSAMLRRAARARTVCLPMSRWAGRSLVEDYGVPASRVHAVGAPVDTAFWSPGADGDRPDGPPTLVFVGNDFERKGGALLLELYRRLPPGRCRLTIVSSDSALTGRALPDGVVHRANLGPEALREVYRTAALLVFPTRRDHSPWVLAEAAAAGLPVVATAVGGVPELVRDGTSGCILPLDAGIDDWTRAVRALLDDPARLRALGDGARAHALQQLDVRHFDAAMRDALAQAAALPAPPA